MIRFNQVKELIIVDLLQANRQANESGRAKSFDKSNLTMRLLLQNGAFLLIYGFLFGSMMFNVPLPAFPGLFTQSIGFMVLFVFLQIYQLIFNLFYDDANLSEHLPLPFSMGELFLSKLMTIILNTFAFFLLPLVLMAMLGRQAGHHLLIVIPGAFIFTLFIMVVMILLPFAFIHLLHQIPFYLKYKKAFTIIIYLTLFGFLFYALNANDPGTSGSAGALDPAPNPFFVGFHEIFMPGQFGSGVVKVGLWGLIAAALSFIAYQWIIPSLYSEEKQSTATPRKAKQKRRGTRTLQNTSKWKVFLKYQLRQLQDTTFIIQMLFSKLYFPIFMLGPILLSDAGLNLSFLAELSNFWGIYLLAGAAFAVLTIGEISISGIIISFDKENYHYIQSLPLSFRQYMQFKFSFSFVFEWLVGAIILIIISVLANLPIPILFVGLIGFTLGTFMMVLYFFMRDHRLLNLSWNNFTELMQRGLNRFLRLFFIFIGFLVSLLGIMGLSFLLITKNQPALTLGVSALIAGILVLSAVGIYSYSKKKFWVKFNA